MEDTTDILNKGLIPLIFAFLDEKYYMCPNDYINPDKVLNFLRSAKFNLDKCYKNEPFTKNNRLSESFYQNDYIAKMIVYVYDIMNEDDCINFIQRLNVICDRFKTWTLRDFVDKNTLQKIVDKISNQLFIHLKILLYGEMTERLIERLDQLYDGDEIETFYDELINFMEEKNDMFYLNQYDEPFMVSSTPNIMSIELQSYLCDTFIPRTCDSVSLMRLWVVYLLFNEGVAADSVAKIIISDSRFIEWIHSDSMIQSYINTHNLWHIIELYEQTHNPIAEFPFVVSLYAIVHCESMFADKAELISAHLHPLVSKYMQLNRNFMKELHTYSLEHDSYDKIYKFLNGHYSWNSMSDEDTGLLMDFMTEQINNS